MLDQIWCQVIWMLKLARQAVPGIQAVPTSHLAVECQRYTTYGGGTQNGRGVAASGRHVYPRNQAPAKGQSSLNPSIYGSSSQPPNSRVGKWWRPHHLCMRITGNLCFLSNCWNVHCAGKIGSGHPVTVT